MIFNLALFSSLLEEAPAFAIPVFTNSLSNQTYVQNLSPRGTIISFDLFDIGNFFSIPSLAPIVTLQAGDQGILAHWGEDGTVHTGTADELRAVLSAAIINPESHPFANVERAMFLEDGAQVRNAAKIAALRLSDQSARDSYSSRVVQRVKVYQDLRTECSDFEEYKSDNIDDLISQLDNELDSDRWIDLWVSAWGSHYNNIQLVKAAIKRISSLGLGEEEYDIIERLRYPTREEHLPFYKWWLNHRESSHPGWIRVWVTMSYYSDNIDAKKVVDALREAFDNRIINTNQWSLLNAWYRCFYQLTESRSDLIDIISKRYSSFYREYLIELVISPITRQIPTHDWATSILRSWFQRVTGGSLWIREFISQGRDTLEKSNFERLGVLWLRRFGSGTNRWLELFELLEYSMTDDESWLIRALWLRRAKKDLSSWPIVFESLADSAGPSQFAELSEIAKLWQFRGRHKRSDATIEDFASR